jgi:uncharacterized repeat protein (TIGR02543 family)
VFASSVSDTVLERRTGGILVLPGDTVYENIYWYGDLNFIQKYSGTVPSGYTLTVRANHTFTIAENVKLFNKGTIYEHEDGLIVNVLTNFDRDGNSIRLIFEKRTIPAVVGQTLGELNLDTTYPPITRPGTVNWDWDLMKHEYTEATFVGAPDGERKELILKFTPDEDHIELYAVVNIDAELDVSERTWEVTFVIGNANLDSGDLVQFVLDGDNAIPPNITPPYGSLFVKWDGVYENITYSRAITAVFEPVNWTVTFHLVEGIYAGEEEVPLEQTVPHGATATRPTPDPTRVGFTFVGWFTAETDGELFDFDTLITEHTNIYARWTPVNQNQNQNQDPDPQPQPQQLQTEPEPEVLPIRFREAYLVGILNEVGVRLISPYSNITRAEIATVFLRKATDEMREEFWVQENPFDDVELEHWFNNAISTTVNMGLFDGIGDDTFAPTQPATRGELAAVLVRFMHIDAEPFSAVSEGSDRFNDIYDHWARAYINEAAANGWVQGLEGIYGPFNPDQPISRAEAAAMFNRAFERLVETVDCLLPDMLAFPDKTQDAWYYTYLKIASNSYTYERREDNPLYKNLVEVIVPRDWTVLERPDLLRS